MKLNPKKCEISPFSRIKLKTVQKNLLKFADNPIFPLWVNQAKTIQLNPRKMQNDLS